MGTGLASWTTQGKVPFGSSSVFVPNNEKEDECLVLSFVYGHSLNTRKRYWWPGTW